MTAKLTVSILLAAAITAATACSDPGLGDAQLANLEDSVTLGALTGSPLSTPSGFSVAEGFAVQTDRASGFDFVYEVLPDQRHVLMPLAAIGMEITNGTNPGLFKYTGGTFESIINAPTSGYRIRDTLAISVGDVILARSRVICYLSVPQYGKFKVLAFDDTRRTVKLQALIGINCGYRNLQPGVPVD